MYGDVGEMAKFNDNTYKGGNEHVVFGAAAIDEMISIINLAL